MARFEIELNNFILDPDLVKRFIREYTVFCLFCNAVGYTPCQDNIRYLYETITVNRDNTYVPIETIFRNMCLYDCQVNYVSDSGAYQWSTYKHTVSDIYYRMIHKVQDNPFTDLDMVTSKGKLGKRLAKHIFKTYGVSVKDTVEHVITRLSGYYIDGGKLYLDIDDQYYLINGTVGDDESCIFSSDGCNRHMYYRLEPSGALVVRASTDTEGFIARAILFKDELNPDNLIMINGYGRSWLNGRSRDTQVIDRLAPFVAQALGLQYAPVWTRSKLFWINAGHGILLANEIKQRDSFQIHVVQDTGHEFNCQECSDLSNDKEPGVFTTEHGFKVCGRCFKEKYAECSICHQFVHSDYMHYMANEDLICNSCINTGVYARCNRCDRFCHHDNMYTYETFHFCSKCIGKLQRCNRCGNRVTVFEDGGHIVNSNLYGMRYYCNKCCTEEPALREQRLGH